MKFCIYNKISKYLISCINILLVKKYMKAHLIFMLNILI